MVVFFPQRFPGARAVCTGLWHTLLRCVLPIKLMTGCITLVLNLVFSEIGLRGINKTPSSNSYQVIYAVVRFSDCSKSHSSVDFSGVTPVYTTAGSD